jgi:CRISPR/Cas system endoribonuclease Cas6 (RAMP superfamily)
MFETELSKLLRQNETAAQTDLEYIAKDNELAHNVINEILKSLIERVVKLEEYISTEITSPSNINWSMFSPLCFNILEHSITKLSSNP